MLRRLSSSGEVLADLAFQQFLQFRVHESVVVMDIEADHFFAGDNVGIFLRYPPQMLFFHTKDQISPSQQPGSDFDAGVLFGSCGAGPVPVIAVEELFRSQAAPFILAAQK